MEEQMIHVCKIKVTVFMWQMYKKYVIVFVLQMYKIYVIVFILHLYKHTRTHTQ